jgi:multidrug efflux pump subunit AcrA (membrane-fusion protein)
VAQFATPFEGRVTRTANAVDPNTRTLLTEVQVRNPKQNLLPGMYADVKLTNMRMNPPLLIPGDSIMTNANGIQVAILREATGQHPSGARAIHIQNVEVGRDYGPEIEVTRGLQGWEYVVVNPSDVVEEGAIVQPVNAPKPRTGQRPTNQAPSTTPPVPGAADTGGRGASVKAPGQKQ